MRGTPWKALFVLSLLLVAAGCVLLIWGVLRGVPWQVAITGVFVAVLGSLLARMNYRAHRHAIVPGPGTTLPIVAVCVAALLWIAIVARVL